MKEYILIILLISSQIYQNEGLSTRRAYHTLEECVKDGEKAKATGGVTYICAESPGEDKIWERESYSWECEQRGCTDGKPSPDLDMD